MALQCCRLRESVERCEHSESFSDRYAELCFFNCGNVLIRVCCCLLSFNFIPKVQFIYEILNEDFVIFNLMTNTTKYTPVTLLDDYKYISQSYQFHYQDRYGAMGERAKAVSSS